jgi:large subunit ribosomal protein L13
MMITKIKSTKLAEIKREWHLINAADKVLGRTACEIAELLIGKRKSYFVNYLDCGDYVVVINAQKIRVTGKKEKEKTYDSYSGYPGGHKVTTLEKLRESHPERIIELAVKNMLPKNKLRDQRMARLKVFPGGEHPYKDKLEVKN